MRVISLELANFRNYAALRFAPPEGACVLVGENAQGKSNLLEGLSLLATGKSFRASRESDLIAVDAPSASVSARVLTRTGELNATCVITRSGEGARKRFVRQGRGVPYAQFLGGVAAVTFVPADLQMVTGPASLRRRLLNSALSQANRAYYRDLAAYAKVLAQKNALLRSPDASDRALLATYNQQIAEIGARIVCTRAAYVRRLGAEAAATHARWLGAAAALEITYAPQPGQPDETPAAVVRTLRDALSSATAAEIGRKVSFVGPHRDDLELVLAGRALGRFGSQGQQRTAVLAIKAAEYGLLRQATGEAPLLLLDDVLSELDAHRRRAFMSSLTGFEQAFITATELADAMPDFEADVFEVRAGSITPIAHRRGSAVKAQPLRSAS